jgi:hypothetical protein
MNPRKLSTRAEATAQVGLSRPSQMSRKATPGLKKPVRCFVLRLSPLQRRPDEAVIGYKG